MNNLLSLSFMALLIIVSKYLNATSLELGSKNYLKHLVFEGLVVHQHVPWYKKYISVFDLLNFGFVVVLVTMREKFLDIVDMPWGMQLHEALLSFYVMIYVFILALSLAAFLVYTFAINHPEQISGETHFKSAFVGIIFRSVIVQITIPVIALAVMAPSPFVFGALVALCLPLVMSIKRTPLY